MAESLLATWYRVQWGGEPAGIRTLDTRIKSPMLCQAELPAHALMEPLKLYRRWHCHHKQEGRGRTYQRCLLWTRQRSAIEPMNSARTINQSQNNPVERIFNLSTGQNLTHARPIKSSRVTAPQLRESLLD